MDLAAAWDAALRHFVPPPPSPYRANPVGWVADRLGEHLWSKQREIAESLVTNRRTAVKSCHDVGKSFVASRAAAWFIDTHPPGEAIVVSTAPTYKQVHAILWEEIRRAAKRAAAAGTPLPGRVLQSDEWKLGDGTLIGFGRKPADTDEHGFQGIHRRYVLVILDEACGVPKQLWTAVEAITTNTNCRTLAIGNPDDPASEFAEVCKPGSGWNVVRVSAHDTPNFTGEQVPDELRPLLIEPGWVEDKARRWGTESPLYASKVLGEFPDVGQDVLFPPSLIRAAQERDLDPDDQRTRLGVDVARFGTDRTVLTLARGPVARIVAEYGSVSTTETSGRVTAVAREHRVRRVQVDGVGVGGGVVDQLRDTGVRVHDLQSGGAARDRERFANARAEWYWGLRERFEAGDIDLDPADDELAAQLGSIRYKYTARGQILIESKEDMKKRGLPSPDRADSLVYAYASSGGPAGVAAPVRSGRRVPTMPGAGRGMARRGSGFGR